MLKKYFIIFITTIIYPSAFAQAPVVNCWGLPWCEDEWVTMNPSNPWVSDNKWLEVISNLIWETIQFVAVVAVIALIISWIMYLLSWWDDEKVKKAKNWIIWSLVWVILSVSAWSIINMLNNLYIY